MVDGAEAAEAADADDVTAMLPVSSAATGLFTEANEKGLGDLDFAAVYEIFREVKE